MFNFKSKKSLVALLVVAMFLIANVAVVSAAGQILTPGKWAPNTYKSMQKLIDENGVKSPSYNSSKKPYVVFDWDNTAIMNDTEEALYQYQIFTSSFCLVVGQLGIGKIMVASFVFTLVNICREVLRNVAVEHRAQHIRFKIPLRHMACVNKVGGDFIDAAEQLVPLLIVLSVSHRCCSFKAIHAVSISVKPFSIQKTNSIIAYIYHFHNAA